MSFTPWREKQLRPTPQLGWEVTAVSVPNRAVIHFWSREWPEVNTNVQYYSLLTIIYFSFFFKLIKLFFSIQGSSAVIRIHGSKKKGTIVQSNIVASNGMIHLINNVMDSVVATVDSDPKVRFNSSLFFLNSPNSRYAYALVEFTSGIWNIWVFAPIFR